ncbi:MAG: hypothetical protein COB22_08365 [Cycloclasticus sp.]|nr:MAG: hypothetical protein COB22_08365 [Cycloclasticus sp.]
MKHISLIAVLIISLSACSSVDVSHDSIKSTDSIKFKTFNVKAPNNDDSLNNERISAAIKQGLVSKGYQFVDNDISDMDARFDRLFEEDIPSKVNVGVGLGSVLGAIGASVGASHRLVYDQETITISLFDKKSNSVVWKGTATDEIESNPTPEQRQAQINKLVHAILETFPASF